MVGDIEGPLQNCSISSALAMKIRQSCTEPSIFHFSAWFTHEMALERSKKFSNSMVTVFKLLITWYNFSVKGTDVFFSTKINWNCNRDKWLPPRFSVGCKYRVSSHEPSQNSLTFPWHFPDHFVIFPDHETYYRHFITALTLILQAIWQITRQK